MVPVIATLPRPTTDIYRSFDQATGEIAGDERVDTETDSKLDSGMHCRSRIRNLLRW
jgi:hypothetical protein